LQKHYYLCICHRKRRRRYNCKQFHHICWTTSRHYNIRNDRFALIKINFSSCQGQWQPPCQHCRIFENVTGVSRNKVFWLHKDSAFQFPKPYMSYFITRPHLISNRTQIYWNCFFVNSCMSFAGVALYKKSLNVFFACLCLEMLCHYVKTAFQNSAGSARSGIPQAFVMICWNFWNWFVVYRYKLILVTLRYIDVDIVLENDSSTSNKLYVDVVFWTIRFSSFAQVRSIWETLNISYLHMHRCNILITQFHDFAESLLIMPSSQEVEKQIQLQAVSPHLLNNLSKLQHQKWQVCYW